MKYKIHLTTDDPEIIEAFQKVGERSKGKLVEKALIYFLSSKKGKDTLELMSKKSKELNVKKGKDMEQNGKICSDLQKSGKGKINIDKFL